MAHYPDEVADLYVRAVASVDELQRSIQKARAADRATIEAWRRVGEIARMVGDVEQRIVALTEGGEQDLSRAAAAKAMVLVTAAKTVVEALEKLAMVMDEDECGSSS
jgi:hypothetical protein